MLKKLKEEEEILSFLKSLNVDRLITVYMNVFEIKTPIKNEDIKKLKAGDIVYLSGVIATARDRVHKKLAEDFLEDFHKKIDVIYHCGPVVKSGRVLSAGPTTSVRMNRYMEKIMENYGTKIVIGKGGMNKEIFKNRGIYLLFTGGCGVLAARKIKRIIKVYFEELGAEAMFFFEVENFGPCVVAIDYYGNSLFFE